MEKLRIAVVDDLPEDRERMVSCVLKADDDLYTESFSSIKDMLSSSNAFHLVLLDVVLHEEDGILESSLLRRKASGCVFMTTMSGRMQEAFSDFTLGYLLKSQRDEEIVSSLRNIITKFRSRFVVIKSGNTDLTVDPDRLLRVYREGRKVYFHTADCKERSEVDLTLQECADLFPRLAYTSRSELVNLEWIDAVHKDSIRLMDGTVVYPSRRYFKAFRERFLEGRLVWRKD